MEGVTDNNAGVHKLSLLPPSPIDKNTPGKSNNEPQSSSQSDGHYFHSLNFITIIFYSVDQFIKDVIFDTCVCVCVCVCLACTTPLFHKKRGAQAMWMDECVPRHTQPLATHSTHIPACLIQSHYYLLH